MKRVLDLRRRLGQTGKYPYLVTDPSDIYYYFGIYWIKCLYFTDRE